MPTNNPRPDPVIPDHEVLRKIGGGAYGEVWLARGVTGALRAVKVVYREDFDDARGFEREFEGILKFEPISRDHPGLVNILHVGRSPDSSFYYYVMELGDDVSTGRDINPIEYEARTLSSDTRRTPGRRLPTEHCIDCGLRLAEALRHLHDGGLAHRDVKPANVIFVNGRAKLADIGLVATRGQRTFVGTEGFVPPEGPGSAQADVYSLGKVLYEIATGKDRLDFPELPDELPTGPERKRWQALNRIICDICEPQLSKRSISSAAELSDALSRLQQGKRRRRRRPVGAFFATLVVGGVIGLGGWALLKQGFGEHLENLNISEIIMPAKPPEKKRVLVKISSEPYGAHVFRSDGTGLKQLQDAPSDYWGEEGEVVFFVLKLEGYKDAQTEEMTLVDKGEPETVYKKLKNDSPPIPAQIWKDQLKQSYRPIVQAPNPATPDVPAKSYHETDWPVAKEPWEQYLRDKKRPPESGEFVEMDAASEKRIIVLTTEAEAKRFCAWLTEEGVLQGFLTSQHQITPVMQDFTGPGMSDRARNDGLRPFLCQVRVIPDATIAITTMPGGAEVWCRAQGQAGQTSAGRTTEKEPLIIDELKPGETFISIVLDGYKPLNETFTLKPGETKKIVRKLELNHSVVMDKEWTNSLGMTFVPVAPDLMASAYETRVKDYMAFVNATNRAMPTHPDFEQDPETHPVVFVSREDAMDFCAWLTKKEQAKDQERLTANHIYRLPNDYEWSLMVGLDEEKDSTPARRDIQTQSYQTPLQPPYRPAPRFLWGTQSTPPDGFANLADAGSDSDLLFGSSSRVIAGYHDPYKFTAPVGRFQPFRGLYDLCGNVSEWVSDNYSATNPVPSGVLRGGGWNTYQLNNLYLSARTVQPPSFRDDATGFRVVLAKQPPAEEKSPEEILPDHG